MMHHCLSYREMLNSHFVEEKYYEELQQRGEGELLC